jgi:predicted acetyltransferase
MDEVFTAASCGQHTSVLVDVRDFKGRLGPFDILHIVRQVFQKYRRRGIQRAVIVDMEIPGMRKWFIETVAQNRGFNLRMFRDIDEALRWFQA